MDSKCGRLLYTQWVLNSHWYVLSGRYLKPPLPSSKTLRSMVYGLVEVCSGAGWLGVTVEQASKGAPVGKEMTGTAVDTRSNTAATKALMFECVLYLYNKKGSLS